MSILARNKILYVLRLERSTSLNRKPVGWNFQQKKNIKGKEINWSRSEPESLNSRINDHFDGVKPTGLN